MKASKSKFLFDKIFDHQEKQQLNLQSKKTTIKDFYFINNSVNQIPILQDYNENESDKLFEKFKESLIKSYDPILIRYFGLDILKKDLINFEKNNILTEKMIIFLLNYINSVQNLTNNNIMSFQLIRIISDKSNENKIHYNVVKLNFDQDFENSKYFLYILNYNEHYIFSIIDIKEKQGYLYNFCKIDDFDFSSLIKKINNNFLKFDYKDYINQSNVSTNESINKKNYCSLFFIYMLFELYLNEKLEKIEPISDLKLLNQTIKKIDWVFFLFLDKKDENDRKSNYYFKKNNNYRKTKMDDKKSNLPTIQNSATRNHTYDFSIKDNSLTRSDILKLIDETKNELITEIKDKNNKKNCKNKLNINQMIEHQHYVNLLFYYNQFYPEIYSQFIQKYTQKYHQTIFNSFGL